MGSKLAAAEIGFTRVRSLLSVVLALQPDPDQTGSSSNPHPSGKARTQLLRSPRSDSHQRCGSHGELGWNKRTRKREREKALPREWRVEGNVCGAALRLQEHNHKPLGT